MNSLDSMKVLIKAEILRLVQGDATRRKDCEKLLAFMERVDNGFTRKNLSGHITASGWVVNDSFTKVLLVHHRILDTWINPGGHLEVRETPGEAAAREVFEETGVKEFHEGIPPLFDVGVYQIPENTIKQEPEHWHYVLSYLLIATNEELSMDPEEIEDAKWVDLDVIVNAPERFEQSVVRMARRTLGMPSIEEA